LVAAAGAPWVAAAALAGLAAIIVARKWLTRQLSEVLKLGQLPRWHDMAAWLSLFALSWVAGGVVLFFLTQATWPVSAGHFREVLGIWALAGMSGLLAFFLPGGFGVREVSLTVLLANLVPTSLAVVIAVGSRAFLLLAELLLVGLVLGLSASLQALLGRSSPAVRLDSLGSKDAMR